MGAGRASAATLFPNTNVGTPSATQTISFQFTSATVLGTPAYAVLTQGAPNLDFQVAATQSASGACTAGQGYSAQQSCSVNVVFNPLKPGLRLGAVQLLDSNGQPLATEYISGSGTGAQLGYATLNSSGAYLPSSQNALGSGFSYPEGVAVDAAGNVFVGDSSNNAVKELLAAGNYTTVRTLGGGFNSPNGVAVDGAGNVFVADTGNNAVKEILAAGNYTTVITLGSGFHNPEGVAVDAAGNVFVADTGNNAVKEILAAGNYTIVITLGSGFHNPEGVAVDAAGNVFVADSSNKAVKEILAAGNYTTVQTLGSGFSLPTKVAVDAAGNVFVADYSSGAFKEILAAGGYNTVLTLGKSSRPAGVAVDGAGNVFVADFGLGVQLLTYATPPSLNFASTLDGATSSDSPKSLLLENTGNAALTGSYAISPNWLQATGSGTPADCSATALSLNPGTFCTLSLSFQPAAAGSLTGSVALTDNASGTPQAISLSGTGVAVLTSVTITPTSASINVGGTQQFTATGTYSDASTQDLTSQVTWSSTDTNVATISSAGLASGVALGNTSINASLGVVNATAAPLLVTGAFPSTNVGSASTAQTVYFTFAGTTTLGTPAYAVLTQGAPNLDFQAVATPPANACQSQTYSAGQSCAVSVVFKPTHPGLRMGAVQVLDSTGQPLATEYISGSGTGAQVGYATLNSAGAYLPSLQKTLGSGFSYPEGVAVDGAGNVFVADYNNGAVKEILTAGNYTTVRTLGSGFNAPTGVAVDGAGNIFVTDYFNGAVKEILAAGNYTTVLTLGSGFGHPEGVAVDGAGNVFVADTDNNAVKEILAAGNYTAVKTLGGGFYQPEGVAVDAAGNVFVADSNNKAVKEILAAGNYTTVQTLGSGISLPTKVAVDGAGNVFVNDYNNGAVKEILAAGGYNTVLTLGKSSRPAGVAVDGAGNVFVADWDLNIQLLTYATPPSLSFASTLEGATSSDSPQSLLLENTGNAALTGSYAISPNWLQTTGSGTPADCSATSLSLNPGVFCTLNVSFKPASIGSLTGSVALTDNASGTPQAISLSGTGAAALTSITITPTSASINVGGTQQFKATGTYSDASTQDLTSQVTWSSTDTNVATISSAGLASGVALGNTSINASLGGVSATAVPLLVTGAFPSTNVGSSSTAQTVYFTFAGTTTLGTPAYAVLTQGAPNLDFQAAATQPANACQSQTYNAGQSCAVSVVFQPTRPGLRMGAVQVLDSNGQPLATEYISGSGTGAQVGYATLNSAGAYLPSLQKTLGSGFSSPEGVAVDAAGNVFVADYSNSAVKEILAAGGYTIVRTLGSGFFNPTGVAVDGAGNIFVTDYFNGAVKEIVAAGNYTTILKLGSGFSRPGGVAVDGAGNVFVADTSNSAVKEILAAGNYTTVRTLGSGFNGPYGVAVDGAGNVFVADAGTAAVEEILAAGGYTTVLTLGSGFKDPFSVAVDGAGNVFVADYSRGAVKEILAAGNYTTVLTLGGGFNTPYGVALDGAGNVFVADTKNNRIQLLNYAAPPSLSFASTADGATSSDSPQSLLLENTGNAALTGSYAISSNWLQATGSGTPADCSATALSLNPGAFCTLSLSFQPVAPANGAVTGSVALTNNAPNTPQAISLQGTAVGLEPVTINTVPSGLQVSIDSASPQPTPITTNLLIGQHKLSVVATQGSNGTRYTFTGWADGTTTTTNSITVGTSTNAYTANFTTSYLLTINVSPAGAGTASPSAASPTNDGYYPSGTQLNLTATPASAANKFSSWTGTSSGSSSLLAITMNSPVTETANFVVNPGLGGPTLAFEPFGASAGTPLQGLSGSGDSGWASPWVEQTGSTANPGYQTASANPLSYPGLNTTANYAIGGYGYQSAGRMLNVSPAGPFAPYLSLSNGLIGAPGQTIWLSFVIRQDANVNGEINALFLTPVGGSNAWVPQTGIGIGSFGSNWGLQLNNGEPVLSNVAVTPKQTVLLVASITFGSPNVVNLYVNPTSLGTTAPATPSAQLTTTNNIGFQTVSYLGGYSPNYSSLGDIRFGASYASVTPTLLTPQTITFTPVPSPQTYPVAPITLSANASSGLPVTFSVLSGPATVNGNTLTITGVGNVLVAADQAGNYLYAPAPEVTQTIAVSVATPTPPPVISTALLAYEPFNENAGSPLQGASGGGDSGWAAPWLEQTGSTTIPGYQVSAANPLVYPGLATTANYAIGGYGYQSAGRQLDTSLAGPFSSYVSGGLISTSGQTVWLSFLLREDANPNNGQINAVFLTQNGGISAWLAQSGIGIGYFGDSPYWGLQLNNGTPLLSNVQVVQGQTVLLVVGITFGPTNTVNLYVNPTSLGGNAPATPSVQLLTASNVGFQSLSYLGGYFTGVSSLGDVRFGSTYAAVTPATGGTTLQSQTINFSVASPVAYPTTTTVALTASASSGLPVTLSVLSGPGSITGSTLTITGTGTIQIAANQAGNSTYAAAPQVVQTLVVNTAGGPVSTTLLAYEPFGEASGMALQGASGGGDSGWNGAWIEQTASTKTPGYQVASANPLTYSGLATTSGYAVGGYGYESAGRLLDTSTNGPFLSYLAGNLIGAPGQTVWLSFLIREDANPNNGQINAVYLTPRGVAWLPQTGIGIGYFGDEAYWGLQLNNGTPVLSTAPVNQGQATLLVVSITFGDTNTVNLYVNPALPGSAPAPSATITTTSSVAFQSFAYLGGYTPGVSSIGAVRFGASFAAVTPSM